ncbi:hypothetical protein WPS_35700 [Vulcanimicrobium alpinum]|uniref:Uncharacterized protein n=1 Tax=Vulcanimicrobium alpinum TaxID=3016050 RepID=A0AAN2CBD4_UNVUL|nr:DUF1203 domain-containing protein [Vulcanimicrobium alpinum]BDE08294.1 hypothetical protein WPS_35700 [Vulcanimicrobium alpinum]
MRYPPIDQSVARRARDMLRDEHGDAWTVQTSTDEGNPCRACLRLTPAGTRLILLAQRPFRTGGPYAETGPIFVHADAADCEPYAAVETCPPDFRPRTLTFRAYDRDGTQLTSITDERRGSSAPNIDIISVSNVASYNNPGLGMPHALTEGCRRNDTRNESTALARAASFVVSIAGAPAECQGPEQPAKQVRFLQLRGVLPPACIHAEIIALPLP